MALISWGRAMGKAIEAGVEVKEITLCGCLIGLKIGEQEVRADKEGWYSEVRVDEAIRAAQRRAAA